MDKLEAKPKGIAIKGKKNNINKTKINCFFEKKEIFSNFK